MRENPNMHTELRPSIRPSSAYARLPLVGEALPEIALLDQLARDRRRAARQHDLRPRLRPRQEPLGVPSTPEALLVQSLDPMRVSAWLRA